MCVCVCSQSVQLAAMVWVVTSTAYARMEGHVTGSVGTAHVLVDGVEWPVNWVKQTKPFTVAFKVIQITVCIKLFARS